MLQVSLHIISLDNAASGRQEEKQFNTKVLADLTKEVKHKETHVQTPAELLGMFKCKEYSNTAYYAGPFTIGNMMTIRIKVHFSSLIHVPSAMLATITKALPKCSSY